MDRSISSNSAFYEGSRLFRRELTVCWRICGIDALFGFLYVILGFYLYQQIGRSPDYYVVTPLVLASGVTSYLATRILHGYSKGATATYFLSLPRCRITAFNAQILFLVTAVICFEVLTLVGTAMKLGGGSVTLNYHLYPMMFALPFLVLAMTVAFHLSERAFIYSTCLVVLYMFISFVLFEWPDLQFNVSMITQCFLALAMLVLALKIIQRTKHKWSIQEIGEST